MFCVTVIDSNIFNNNKYPMKPTHTHKLRTARRHTVIVLAVRVRHKRVRALRLIVLLHRLRHVAAAAAVVAAAAVAMLVMLPIVWLMMMRLLVLMVVVLGRVSGRRQTVNVLLAHVIGIGVVECGGQQAARGRMRPEGSGRQIETVHLCACTRDRLVNVAATLSACQGG